MDKSFDVVEARHGRRLLDLANAEDHVGERTSMWLRWLIEYGPALLDAVDETDR